MREKVLALAQGKFHYKEPKIIVSTKAINLTVPEGGEAETVLVVENENHTKIKGFGAAEELHFDFLPVFDGKRNEITLRVHAGNKKAGDSMKGEIVLATDCGECTIPYKIQIVGSYLTGANGVITSYGDFVEYAKEDFERAAVLFSQERFRECYLKTMSDKRLYQKLTQRNSKKQALEEFLVAHGDKKPLQFMVNKTQISLEVKEEDVTVDVTVAKASWGEVSIRVSSACPYLSLEKECLRTSDFAKDQASLRFTVKAGELPPGIHRGSIVLENMYQKIEIGVRIHGVRGIRERKRSRVGKKLTAGLVKSHIQYKMNSGLREQWIHLLLTHRDSICAYYLEQELTFGGYISLLTKNEKERKSFVNAVEGMPSPEYGEAFEKVRRYLEKAYVKCKINNDADETQVLCQMIKGYYNNGYRHWSLLIMLEGLGFFQENEDGLWGELDQLCEEGCSSPYVYLLRMLRILQEPELVKQLDGKNVGTLLFGLKHDLITEDLVITISFLASREKRFTPGLMALLTGCYEKFRNKDTLYSICALLIRSEKQESRFFRWFELGVQNRLRITELFEYYMYTLEPERFDEVLTDMISYFQYENHLRDSVKVKFYACIVRNRGEHPEYFQAYRPAIEAFAWKQLEEHRINPDLAVLYEAFFSADCIKDRVAKDLPSVLFVHQLTCLNPNMERVVVVHDEGGGELVYNLTNGSAQIAIATPHYKLYFVDKVGHYHADTIAYRLEKLLHLDALAGHCYEQGADHALLMLHLFSKVLEEKEMGTREALILHMQVRERVPGLEYRARALLALYEYYKTAEDDELLEEVLREIDFDYVPQVRYAGLLQTMIQHKMNDRALEVLRKYEILNCTKKLLLLLISWKLEESGGKFDPYYMRLCYYLYRHGVKNNTTLSYLIHYYMGRTETLLEIYRRGAKSGAKIKDGGTERVLGQALFVSDDPYRYTDLFLPYYDYGANRILVKAFLLYTAYRYLTEQCELDPKVREKLQKEGMAEDNPLMLLAVLRYDSEKENYTDSEREFIEYYLSCYVATGRGMRFMKGFIGKVDVPFEVERADWIQVFSPYEGDVHVEVERDGTVVSEPMKKLFPGIYASEMLLFGGEQISYRIFFRDATNRLAHGELRKDVHRNAKMSAFYDIVNEMICAKQEGEEERFRTLAENYQSRKMAAERLFSPL